MKILVIEDEQDLRDSIVGYFTAAGDVCETAADYASASAKINLYQYDCILLDITLPGGHGLGLLKLLKDQQRPDGVLIVSAKNALDDRLSGLDMGADDYLTKPFHLSELKSRVTAIVRRKTFNGNNSLVFKEINIDLMSKDVKVGKKKLKLTPKEYAMLLYFIANQGRVVSKGAIAEHIWGDRADTADDLNFVYSHIKNLRKKLLNAGTGDYIQAAYGMGYKFIDQ